MTLKEALKVILVDESLGDFIYEVRDRASETRAPEDEYTDRWELPRVQRFGQAVSILQKYYNSLPEIAETD